MLLLVLWNIIIQFLKWQSLPGPWGIVTSLAVTAERIKQVHFTWKPNNFLQLMMPSFGHQHLLDQKEFITLYQVSMIDAESWESAIRDVLLYIITKLLNALGSTQWGIEYTGPYTVPRLGEVLLLSKWNSSHRLTCSTILVSIRRISSLCSPAAKLVFSSLTRFWVVLYITM